MSIEPANLTAQLLHRAAGNPPSTLPDSAISNCFPGLEFDFRNVWRRLLEGIVLHEASGFVVGAEGEHERLAYRFLISVADFPTLMDVRDPNGADAGSAFMEWSNALADVVAQHAGERVPCVFFDPQNPEADLETVELRVADVRAQRDHTGADICDRRAARAARRADPEPLLAVAERLPGVWLLLLGCKPPGLRQPRAHRGRRDRQQVAGAVP
jgi:hypothetical protein